VALDKIYTSSPYKSSLLEKDDINNPNEIGLTKPRPVGARLTIHLDFVLTFGQNQA